ncbi:cell envelope-related transcriptional attenuator [Deinococcus proteolyticus MRP]|uniref:Cell envelope-related transcriptional attenuator n=1 Tax=Deinococcus proteolyticus (strain ATCC 35074 / DSM 20540 / JCM 6276 / NBRC 101906 / NCIMB 13154 / VKM Ac-1939 / CCM 2703 / MRP) TaxID=693977 RepID=F0RL27_DEIPM|nr:LCP family protein [Deinococcus proteolyticus]ADY25800.1 cell envelope-related transcriptional attenuator [Deinococcus proteolyticus MRP]
MRASFTFFGLLLAAFLALLAPAAPALARYGALPRSMGQPLNILLAGVTPKYPPSAIWPYPAAPEDFTGLTDTIMLAQIHPDGAVKLLSVPRDSWVEIPGVGMSKINASNARGGPELLMQTVGDLTGLEIDGYALLSLHAVRSMTDAAGGVTVEVKQPMKYDDNAGNLHIDLQPGVQRLNGEQMEGFLRFRKDNLSDIGRIGRQQQFVGAFTEQMKQPLNWWRWPVVAGALNANTKSDLTRGEVGAVLAAALHGPKVNTFMVPGDFGARGTWAVDHAALRELVQREFSAGSQGRAQPASGDHDVQTAALDTEMAITILNVGAPAGSAGRLADALRAQGFSNLTVGNGQGPLAVTQIQGPAAEQVQDLLNFGEADTAPNPDGSDLVIRLGADVPLP